MTFDPLQSSPPLNPPLTGAPQALLWSLAAGVLSILLFLAFSINQIGPLPLPFFGLSLAYLAPLPLLLAGFCLGRSAGYIGAGMAVIMAAILTQDLAMAGIFLIAIALPAALLVMAAYQPGHQAPPGYFAPPRNYFLLLLGLTALFFIAANVVAICNPPTSIDAHGQKIDWRFGPPLLEHIWRGVEGGIDTLREAMAAAIKNSGTTPSAEQASQAKQLFDVMHQSGLMLTPYVPGLMLDAWLVQFLLNLWLTGAYADHKGWTRRKVIPWRTLTMPKIFSLLLALSALGAFLLPDTPFPYLRFVAKDCLICLATPFVLLGFIVCHTVINGIAARRSWSKWLKIIVYLILYTIVIMPAVIEMIILLGAGEEWLQLRRRFAITTT